MKASFRAPYVIHQNCQKLGEHLAWVKNEFCISKLECMSHNAITKFEMIFHFQMAESFKGCMRKFTLNSKHVDLANSKAIMGVRQCFSDFEPGVHFDGYGYGIYGGFRFGSFLQLY